MLTVTARDAAGNTSTDTLTVTYTPPADTTPPVVTITGPTSAATYATATTPLTLERDGLGQRRGDAGHAGRTIGAESGTATGTTSWTVSGIALLSGANVLTVTARDAAGNTSTDTLTVTYTPPADTTPPVVTITGPTSAATIRDGDDAADAERDGLGQRGGDAGHLGERSGRVGARRPARRAGR